MSNNHLYEPPEYWYKSNEEKARIDYDKEFSAEAKENLLGFFKVLIGWDAASKRGEERKEDVND